MFLPDFNLAVAVHVGVLVQEVQVEDLPIEDDPDEVLGWQEIVQLKVGMKVFHYIEFNHNKKNSIKGFYKTTVILLSILFGNVNPKFLRFLQVRIWTSS